MRFATFNVHHCEGRDGVIDLDRVARVISLTDASVVALQELDQGMARSGRVDQPRVLEELTGMTIRFFPTLRRGQGRFGVGVATRGPIEARLEQLPRSAGEEPRGVIVARWQGISVLATHLSRQAGPRAAQTRALAATAAERPPPVIVMGDLNQRADALGPLVEVGFSFPASPEATFGRGPTRRQIDFVLAGPGVKVTAWSAIPSNASDHRALVATVESA
ncbi:MAG: endonuclease/exonuclease/phosphatase family protein [Actinomycetota bacterium]|nr:endonuclease/exonuclease/phosphatase family protein [Actinomycetota bacterium]